MVAGHAYVFPRFLAFQIDAKFDFRNTKHKDKFQFAGPCNRQLMGFPAIWSIIWGWMAFSGPTTAVDEEPVQKIPVKNKEVLQLLSYSPPLPAKFWQTVPFREIPGTIIKRLN